MGCDIHLYVEVLQRRTWVPYLKEFPNPAYNPEHEYYCKYPQYTSQLKSGYPEQETEVSMTFIEKEGDWIEVPWSSVYDLPELHSSVYRARNYDLFSMLADVRNGYGFAGIPTGDRIVPIDSPRGLPDNISPEVQLQADLWSSDGHSHSWLLLSELEQYDWHGQTKIHTGIVHPHEYGYFKTHGYPRSWSGDVGGPGVQKVSNEEMDKLWEELVHSERIPEDTKWVVTRIIWETSYYDSVQYFVDKIIPLLQTFGKSNKVRIVFWFDN